MNRSKLFNRTRISLAVSYGGVMGLILSLLGLGTYQAISHAHWLALDRELESLAGTLHDSLELKLKQPGRLEPIVYEFLPNLCLVGTACDTERSPNTRHIPSIITQDNYYIRLFDTSGRLIAVTETDPEGLPQIFNRDLWQTLSDDQSHNYRQISLALHTYDMIFKIGATFK